MTTTYFAQPYDISAIGFYFESEAEFREKMGKARNDYGQPVEEFEIQFIDGEAIDAALADAWEINQANIPAFMEAVNDWDEDEKRRFIIAVGECGYAFDPQADRPNEAEAVAMMRARKSNTEAIALIVGVDPNQPPILQSFELSESEKAAASALAETIVGNLRSGNLNHELKLAALARAVTALTDDIDQVEA